ncbi:MULTISPECIES: hypothetical protein [Mucilaginibacter]|uniref:Uncharacterized protein n=1 Tax=Mucilaginibacter rubeus TaxID=2027860 RepID=A0A5C1I4Q2_9SPHI|nr:MULTISPECIES: hypothetical protein [Mucilaginibacter]QEM12869.1 hypothetical protein DEO27_023610 [Mucilaginibacter rubeus]
MGHHKEEKENFDFIYYLVGLVTGLFVGFIIDKGFTWIFVGGVLGLLTAAAYIAVLVRGRNEEA